MKMTERIRKLREQSLNAENRISAERALLITEFYQSGMADAEPVPVQRALAFKYILEHKYICVNEGELIVGERGPAPKATPTYPEICIHSLQDLEILNDRPKVSFKSDETTRAAYRDIIIPYWKGKSNRDRIFQNLPQEWKEAYTAGVFTEFQEQRAPGHTALGIKMFRTGLLDLKEEIAESLAKTDLVNDPEGVDKRDELRAMDIVCDAMIRYAERYAERLEELAAEEKDPVRKKELEKMAAICRRVPAHAPTTVHEALQHYWFIHLGVVTELNPWDSFNPGRLDQSLYPLYKKQLEEGTVTQEEVYEMLQSFWVKFNNHPSPPKVGVTAEESNTYTDFCLINVGGVKEDGSDGVNEMSYILLDVIREMGGVVVDCDAVYHEMLNGSEEMRNTINAVFPGVFDADGKLNRQKLGEEVFSRRERLARLNDIVYHFVVPEVERRLGKDTGLYAIDAINLLESGISELCDKTIAVTAPTELRVRRIMARDGISEQYARMRITAQKPDEYYRTKCDCELTNAADTPESFREEAREFIRRLMETIKEEKTHGNE